MIAVAGCIKNKRHKKTTDGGNQLFDKREFITLGVLGIASLKLTIMLWVIFLFLFKSRVFKDKSCVLKN